MKVGSTKNDMIHVQKRLENYDVIYDTDVYTQRFSLQSTPRQMYFCQHECL